MSTRGFTLVELLVASLLTRWWWPPPLAMASSAGRHSPSSPRRSTPCVACTPRAPTLSLPRWRCRRRAALVGDGVASFAANVPIVQAADCVDRRARRSRSSRSTLRAIEGGLGRLAAPQPGPAGSLTLDRGCVADARSRPLSAGSMSATSRRCSTAAVTTTCSRSAASRMRSSRITPRRAARLRLRHRRVGAGGSGRSRSDLLRQSDGSQALTRITLVGRARADGRRRRRSGVRRVGPGAGAGDPRCGDRSWCRTVRLAATGALEPDPDNVFAAGAHCMIARAGPVAGVTAGVLRTRGRRPGEVRAGRLRGWSVVSLRRIARSLRRGPPSHQPRSTSACGSRCSRRSFADRPDGCSRAAAPPLEMPRSGCSTARS